MPRSICLRPQALLRLVLLPALVCALACATARADEWKDATYAPPKGWTSKPQGDSMTLVPDDATDATRAVLVVKPAEDLGSEDFRAWFDVRLAGMVAEGSAVAQAGEVRPGGSEGARTLTTARAIRNAAGVLTIQMAHAVTDGRRVALAIAVAASPAAAEARAGTIHAFFESLGLAGSAKPATPPGPARKGPAERVPDAAVVDGRPKGLFLGTSLLSGRAVCLLFLDHDRITRFVPEEDLEAFHWEQHLLDHRGDCGTWTLAGKTLRVVWGDGGVHEGPLATTADGLEFQGKRYAKPVEISLKALAGSWEAARTSGPLTVAHALTIAADGAFHWTVDSGGVVAGRAVHSRPKDLEGTMSIHGATATFRAKDGTVETHPFAAVADPAVAFFLGGNVFTRASR